MQASKLPDNFRDIAHASALRTMLGPGHGVVSRIDSHIALVDRICDRAQRLSDAGLLVGDSPAEVANAIYGGWWLWVFVWNNRALLWQIINLLASLTLAVSSDNRVVHTTVAE